MAAPTPKYEFNPADWVTIEEIRINDSYFEGSGLIVKVYRKVTDKYPRMAIQEFYKDKATGETRNGKQVRIDIKNMQQIFDGMKTCYEKIREINKGN